MDITVYSQEIQDLYEDHRQSLRLAEPRVLEVLAQLKQKALELEDDLLLGYTYHSLAFAEYFISGNYDAFLENVQLAAESLLRCDDQSEMLHVHYLIALDALNKGLYDLSYHNFYKAHFAALEAGQETSAAILEESMGHVLSQIGSYEEARVAFKNSLRGVQKDPSHPHYYNNVTSCYMNESHACLELGFPDEAQLAYKQTKSFMDAHPNSFQIDAQINIVLLETRIAIKMGDRERMQRGIEQIIELFDDINQIAPYAADTSKLVYELLALNEYELAGQIVEMITKKYSEDDAHNIQRIFCEAKIAYYRAIDQKELLLASYLEQDSILARISAEQSQGNHYTQDLINLANNLQIEQQRLTRERTELIDYAETDALTGLGNRYAGDQHLTQSLDRSFFRGIRLGVGLLDLDSLKLCNDTYGHQAGDELLINVANALAQLMDDERIFCSRYGGDEFVIVCEGMENSEILDALHHLRTLTEAQFSVGVCNIIPRAKMKIWDFLQEADTELYKVKRAKKAGEETDDVSISSNLKSLSERNQAESTTQE